MRPSLIEPGNLPGPGRLVLPAGGRRARRRRVEWTWPRREGVASFERPTVPPPVGERGDQPVLVLLVIDESPSEQGVDPNGYRHVAAQRIVELLRTELRHRGDLVGCVHFSTQPYPWLRPTSPHTKTGRRALRLMLRPAGGGGGTDIRAALMQGARLIPSHWPGVVVAVLLSDGEDGSTGSQLRKVVNRYPIGAVHGLSIGKPLPEPWPDLPLGSTAVIPSMARPDEVEWAAARVLYRALGLGWPGPDQPTGGADE